MENKDISREEAREALDAVHAIENSNAPKSSPGAVWSGVIIGAMFAAAVVATLMESNWIFVVMILFAVIVALVLINQNQKNVRASYKQPLQEDTSTTNWYFALVPIIAFAVVTILPHGNLPVALGAGAIAGAITGYVTWRDVALPGGAR